MSLSRGEVWLAVKATCARLPYVRPVRVFLVSVPDVSVSHCLSLSLYLSVCLSVSLCIYIYNTIHVEVSPNVLQDEKFHPL